ncbi:hypothetical protein ABFX02_05G108100 [Erythranthe guttata]
MGSYVQILYCWKNPTFVCSSFLNKDYNFQTKNQCGGNLNYLVGETEIRSKRRLFRRDKGKEGIFVCRGGFMLTWEPNLDSPAIATQLSAFSLLPYLGFLYFITKSNSAPKLTLFGFYFLLAFVCGAIPAGIYAKVHYLKSLANVDWLHGGAESLLMLTNLFIVVGLREGIREAEGKDVNTLNVTSEFTEEEDRS